MARSLVATAARLCIHRLSGTLRSIVEHVTPPVVQAWFAVATKPRSEAVAYENLTRQGYTCLWPRVQRRRRSAGGLRESTECLFPRYLFLQADPQHRSLAPIRSTRGALGLVRFGGQVAQVPDEVIRNIRERMEQGEGFVRLSEPELEPGCRVRVTQGPMSGFDAMFLADQGEDRVVLLLEMLGTTRSVVVPRDQIASRI